MKRKVCCFVLCLALCTCTTLAEGLVNVSDQISSEDLTHDPDISTAAVIELLGNTASCSQKGVAVDGGEITITEGGLYTLSGSLTDGQVIVDVGEKETVHLVLNGAAITSPDSAAILIQEAGKVILTLTGENTLSSTASLLDEKVDAVLYSKSDLTLNGTGTLTVSTDSGSGIVSKDALLMTGGEIEIHSSNHGLTGKDWICITGGSLNITAGGDGIHAKNSEDTALGSVFITGGNIAIRSNDDGISATGNLQIDGGSFEITAGGGSENGTMKTSDAMPWGQQNGTETGSGAKGIKTDGSALISGGDFQLDCAGDAVHSNGNVTIDGGQWTIRSADDGIHADGALHIQDGSFSIPCCYEGLEGKSVQIDGGTFDIVSTDDGINAAGDSELGGFPGGDAQCSIVMNGGTLTIVSGGDCLDSNGSLTLNGGTLNLTCSGNGNTAIDYEFDYTNNGADVTTNDGSENGGTDLHGGFDRGGHGQKPEFFGQNGMQPPDWDAAQQPDGGMPRPDGERDQFQQPPQEGDLPGKSAAMPSGETVG